MDLCPVCRKRPADPSTRRDIQGSHWCKPCQDEFDSIDWDVEGERRMGL